MRHIKPRYLILYLTRKCNMRCPHCIFRLYEKDFFSDEDMDISFGKEIISYYERYGIKELFLTAEGEPLLYENLPELLSYSKKKDFERIHLNTNGLLLHQHLDTIVKYVDSIYISVDGYNRETYKNHRECDAFDKVVENISALTQKNKSSSGSLFISIACVIHEQNIHYIEKMIQLAESLNVNRIEFFNYHAVTKTLSGCIPLYQSDSTKTFFQTIKSSRHYGVEIVLPSLLGDKRKFYCENLFNWIIVGARGNFSPCCQIPPHKKFGNFRDDPKNFIKGDILQFKTEFTNVQSNDDLCYSCRECNGLSPENNIFFPDKKIWTKRYPTSNYSYAFTPRII
ncbi:Radical SAM domain protein [Candidatus Magnetomorum sp. HK-1]|nr:Radical SAM domain protein [Candidatus Magnetomorum sp. HK-1]